MARHEQRHPDRLGTDGDVPAPRAIVVFEDRADKSALRLLRPGFRHCFCLVGAGRTWTICDPLKTRIEIVPLFGPSEDELVRHYVGTGRSVLVGRIAATTAPSWNLRPMSCVETVKRVLRLHAPWVFTPAQLYRALLHPTRPGAGFAARPTGERRVSCPLDGGIL
ncbi:hypothetical protein [Benzoatithermus flavus]|uniref:DUF393 domain-containing protein n=1 Tax=Benzoatithermus flavus TaxID=3108223 RepID=A0ABU8XLA2_9PROT